MRKLLFASILVFAFCFAAFGQDSPCPTITLTSNPTMVTAGEFISYIVHLSEEAKQYKIKYFWAVDEGEIISGQGTPTVKIKTIIDSLNVIVEIQGLPKNCLNTISDSFVIDRPYSNLIDGFSISVSQIDKARLDNLAGYLTNNPTSTGYIFEYFKKKTSQRAIKQKSQRIIDYLVRVKGIEKNMIVLQTISADKNLTRFFAVPAGAIPPTP
jgi:hypothetical protein